METRHSDNDGSDIFWPGYVDATTNLILNLLFLLTILIVAVFMFALELGRASKLEPEMLLATSAAQLETVDTPATTDLAKENMALKKEIERLELLLAERDQQHEKAAKPTKTIEATAKVATPMKGLDRTLATDFELMVHFKPEAIAFNQAEHDRLLESLQPVITRGKTDVYVEVPLGFSEAKRMGFYRAMAVRNLLIEMKLPKEKINVVVFEGAGDANAAVVRVRSR